MVEKDDLSLGFEWVVNCSNSCHTAVHLHDSGLASARSCARIQLDPMLAGCTMTVHVCGPIGNGRGSEARLVARFHTLIIRLPTPYELFGSSNNTVRLSTWPRTVCLDRLPGLVLIVYLLCTSFQPTPYVSMVEHAACRSTPYILTPRLARK